ncbi:MAG: hypothetical protein HOV97_05515 [Nonomuraea sp.]|nr:hypothetical protein [Nonomuraea sp.]
MNQHDAPAYTLATIGHPANRVVIVKTEQGFWRRVDHGSIVPDEDFRAGWRLLVSITEVLIGCHDGCAEFIGGHHKPEINPIDDGPRWRLECPDCGTVLRLCDTRDEAVREAIDHAVSVTPDA